MYALSPKAKKANQASTTELSKADSQLSKKRAVGRQARQRMNSGPTASVKVRKALAKVTTKSARQRKRTLPKAVTTAAKSRSSRVIPESFSRSSTSWLAFSLNPSSKAYGLATAAGSAGVGRKVAATLVVKPLATSTTAATSIPD